MVFEKVQRKKLTKRVQYTWILWNNKIYVHMHWFDFLLEFKAEFIGCHFIKWIVYFEKGKKFMKLEKRIRDRDRDGESNRNKKIDYYH